MLALLAALLNIPTFWLAIAYQNEANAGALVPSLLIYFRGTGGLGISLIFWLMLGSRILQRSNEGSASVDYSRDNSVQSLSISRGCAEPKAKVRYLSCPINPGDSPGDSTNFQIKAPMAAPTSGAIQNNHN